MAVRNCHDLGPFPRSFGPTAIAPFFALLKVASMKASSKSRAPREQQIFGQARRMRYQTAFPYPLLESAMARLVRRVLAAAGLASGSGT